MLKKLLFTLFLLNICVVVSAQVPTDYLPADFHKERRAILRSKMPKNAVAVVFSNPTRNRANDVDYVFHQDPNFYYLTGFREPNAVLVLFSENQKDAKGNSYNEILYVPKKDPRFEMWNGKRLGVEGAKKELGFAMAKTAEEFVTDAINFKSFDKVSILKLNDDYRNTERDKGEIYDLVKAFKKQSGYKNNITKDPNIEYIHKAIANVPDAKLEEVAKELSKNLENYPEYKKDPIIKEYISATDDGLRRELKQKIKIKLQKNSESNIDVKFLSTALAEMREVKTPEELKLLTKAIRISAMGQVEVMKAMKPHMSETEIQGVHEFVYKKYGAEYEGYPSIVGAGNNGCVLHYIENNKTKLGNELVLMDLGAEYRGYTADVTRTIPANGKFSPEQKAIYELVLKAQDAGIKVCKPGNQFWKPGEATKQIINEGLAALGIISSPSAKHNYFPHGTSHHIGLDVHDPGTYGAFKENMVITVEPGIYIPEGSPCDKKWWGIAVRIEDDILITKNGPVNLSAEAPRTVENIEKMMAKKSVLNDFLLPNLD
ncbi:aminopeptidase P family protein [Tenacibaculum discolor]|uniref:aminopeptidase P family protein n=1 Tax=Tenacibaculum discolor TaxID=361581 RepID=UPI000EADF23A|nr:aminopeptidase P family protein [Tenacibaculum discolor]RLK02469.1 aminopeptidase P [Tenacibaculum discolor]